MVKKKSIKNLFKSLPFWLVLIIFLFITIFPFFWMGLSSTKSLIELLSIPPTFLPKTISLHAYTKVLFDLGLVSKFLNSIYVTGLTIVLTLAISIPAAYSIARLRFRGKSVLSGSLLSGYTVAPVLLVVGVFSMFAKIGLTNSLNGLVIAYLPQTIPVSVLLLVGVFKTIPVELEEAALVDGYSRLEVMGKIAIPLAKPGIVTVTIYCFIRGWNEYLYALVFLSDPAKYTLPVGLTFLLKGYYQPWAAIMAGAVIMVIPIVVLFLFLQKYLIKGLTGGAVKE